MKLRYVLLLGLGLWFGGAVLNGDPNAAEAFGVPAAFGPFIASAGVLMVLTSAVLGIVWLARGRKPLRQPRPPKPLPPGVVLRRSDRAA